MLSAALSAAALAALALAAPAAGAAVPLARGGDVLALTATRERAYAVLDAGERSARPFRVAWSDGRRARGLGRIGEREAEFPSIAAAPGGEVFAAWARPVSAGVALTAQRVDDRGAPAELAMGTGPGRLALAADGSAALAYPDRAGDAMVATIPGVTRAASPYDLPSLTALSDDAPGRRHRPLAIALGARGPLVLDLVQRRRVSELRVLGAGAPAAAVVRVPRLTDIPAALAVDGRRVAVAYVSRGRVRLAIATGGADWRRRTLPRGSSRAPVTDAPGLAFDRRGRPVAVYSVPRLGRGDVYAATADGRISLRRLTRTPRIDDAAPFAAAAPGGPLFAAWTRGRRPVATRLR